MPEAATETTVELNGVRLYTRRVGHGPPVVVLHGGPGAHHDYLLPQYDHLAEGGRALLYYDQRGGGRSPVPRDMPVGWREHVADLEALRGHWQLDRLTVVGYSWGGLLALLYALEHPDRIARLALVSSAPVTAAWRDEFIGIGPYKVSRWDQGSSIIAEAHDRFFFGRPKIDPELLRGGCPGLNGFVSVRFHRFALECAE